MLPVCPVYCGCDTSSCVIVIVCYLRSALCRVLSRGIMSCVLCRAVYVTPVRSCHIFAFVTCHICHILSYTQSHVMSHFATCGRIPCSGIQEGCQWTQPRSPCGRRDVHTRSDFLHCLWTGEPSPPVRLHKCVLHHCSPLKVLHNRQHALLVKMSLNTAE